jgi:hemoglobin
MKNDLQNREDIVLLINTFYKKVKVDKTIGFIFKDDADVNQINHLPIMYSFWENILLNSGSVKDQPMSIQQHLNKLVPLIPEYLAAWNKLFNESVDELFTGERANNAKQKAQSISAVMQLKILEKSFSI